MKYQVLYMLQQLTIMAEMAAGDLYGHINVVLCACFMSLNVMSLFGTDFVDVDFVIV